MDEAFSQSRERMIRTKITQLTDTRSLWNQQQAGKVSSLGRKKCTTVILLQWQSLPGCKEPVVVVVHSPSLPWFSWSGEKALHDQRNDDTGPKKRQHSQKRGEFLGVPTPHKTCFGLLLFVARNVCFDSNGLRTTGLIQQPTNDCKMIVKLLLTR